MKLTDAERKENRAAFAEMSLPQKAEYVFEYYKFPLVLILIAAVALGSVLYYRLTRRDPLLYVAYVNFAVGDSMDTALGEDFVRSAGENPRKSEVRVYRNLYLSRDPSAQNHETAYASRLKVLAAATGGQLDVLLMNREAYDILSSDGYLLPLEPLLEKDPGLSARVAGRLVKNTVILEDNEIEHNLDANVPYEAVTEEAVNGLLLSAFPLFERAGFTGEVYFGILGNSARLDTALRYMDYLTAEPPGEI